MSVAVGRLRPPPHRTRLRTRQVSFRPGSRHRRMAAALLAIVILAASVIAGVSVFRPVAPAGELPQPSGNAQLAPVPDR
jgi:hypothetical protein